MAAPPRLRGLDIFRGATVALMILVNNPGSWSHLYPPLAHAPWHGCTPTDLVFPFFLFAVGNALAIVLPRLQAGPPAAFWWKVARRTALIFAIGLFLNASPFVRWDAAGELVPRSLETLRVMGVLQRIALAFGAAAAIVGLLGLRAALPASALLLLAYWALCVMLGAPGDPYSLEGFFGTAVDRAVLGPRHLYQGEGVPFDPEGLASTLPAVAQVLLGCWAGRMVTGDRAVHGAGRPAGNEAAGNPAVPLPGRAQWLQLLAWAAALLLLAATWQPLMPFNKKLWTSSYVLLTTGLAMALLASLLFVVEAHGRAGALRGLARFCEVFGRNPLFVFVLSGFVPRVLALLRWQEGSSATGLPLWTSPLPWLYRHVFAPAGAALSSDPRLGSLLFALANLAVYAGVAWWLDRRRIYIRV
jgi:predicted acyltransferase